MTTKIYIACDTLDRPHCTIPSPGQAGGDHSLIHKAQDNPQSFYRVIKWKPAKMDKVNKIINDANEPQYPIP